jgi:penicillin-binding protein 1C
MTRGRRWVLAAVAGAALGGAALTTWVAWPLPARLLDAPATTSVTVLDRFGQPLRVSHAAADADRRWIPLGEADPDLLRAFIALEDHRFYAHSGVDTKAVLRATRANWHAGRVVSGASTITMQLARLLRPLPRTWPGKLVQALWALRLEAHLTKQQILEQYLNRVPLGQGTVGVAAAADLYFDAAPTRLSLGQAALLASLATAPSRDNPMVDRGRAARRRAEALSRLRARSVISEADSMRAAAEPVVTARPQAFDAPHFTTHVLEWAVAEADAAGAAEAAAGAEIRTTLDLGLETEIESEVRHTVATLADRGARDAAAVVLDNASGAVLAWVGSPDFWGATTGQVDMVTSARQPGSALKPFLYGIAFDHGETPATVLPDVARRYVTPSGVYAPRNYDRRFHGPVRARVALASSDNVPAVELTHRLGIGALLATLHRAGFASLDRPAEYYGLGLALGNGEVTLIELANGYRALANGGTWSPWTWRPLQGSEPSAGTAAVMSPVAAALVLDILADPVARMPGFGPETPFVFPFPAAVKTGTSRNFTDNWAIAVTGRFTAAVWVGDAAGRPMEHVSGVSGAGPLLQRVILRTAERYPPGVLRTPAEAGARRVRICALSGGLATDRCPGMPEWVPPGAHLAPCTWHRPEGTVLPEVYAEWVAEQDRTLSGAAVAALGGAQPAAPPHAGDGARAIRILSPLDGDRYSVPAGTDPRYATIALRAVTHDPAEPVRWFVDGRLVHAERWRLIAGEHRVRAVAADGASDEVRIVVN